MQSERIAPQLKELQQLKFSPSTKVLLLINLSQRKPQEEVSNIEITWTKQKHLVKLKIPSINYPYFAKMFKFFVVKLNFFGKSSDFLLLGRCG